MKISDKNLHLICEGNGKTGVLALSMYIWLANTYPSGLVRDFSVNKLARVCRLSWSTAQKGLDLLVKTGCVVVEGDRLRLISLKGHHRNIDLRKLSGYRHREYHGGGRRSTKTIHELSLIVYGLLIQGILLRKQQIRSLILSANPANKSKDMKGLKAARRKLRQMGIDADKPFVDHGLGYEGICSNLGISNHLVTRILRKCEGLIFNISKRVVQLSWDMKKVYKNLMSHFSKEEVRDYMRELISPNEKVYGDFFLTKSNLYWVRASMFTLLRPFLPV